MRDVEFRAKVLGENEWVYGYPFPILLSNDMTNWHLIAIEKSKSPDGVESHEEYTYEIYPNTIGQYTGLQDKNGVKIFEGDVIGSGVRVGTISYEDGAFVATNPFKWTRLIGYCEYIDGIRPDEWISKHSIIGNIHDNPELIND